MTHVNAIVVVNLSTGHQVRQRLHEQPLDGALQVPRAVPQIGALHQQELPGRLGDMHHERFTCGSMRCCTISTSISTILRSSSLPRDLKTTIASKRLTNSGVNFRRAAAMPAPEIRALSFALLAASARKGAWKPSRGLTKELISAAPRLLVRNTMAAEKSTLRLSPNVKVALSRIPRRRFHKASDAFSISSKSTKLSLIFSV